jgi:hypothetical protein
MLEKQSDAVKMECIISLCSRFIDPRDTKFQRIYIDIFVVRPLKPCDGDSGLMLKVGGYIPRSMTDAEETLPPINK